MTRYWVPADEMTRARIGYTTRAARSLAMSVLP